MKKCDVCKWSHHDAADGTQGESIIGFEETAGTKLQGDGRHKATDDLRRQHRNGRQVDQKYDNVGDVHTWSHT